MFGYILCIFYVTIVMVAMPIGAVPSTHTTIDVGPSSILPDGVHKAPMQKGQSQQEEARSAVRRVGVQVTADGKRTVAVVPNGVRKARTQKDESQQGMVASAVRRVGVGVTANDKPIGADEANASEVMAISKPKWLDSLPEFETADQLRSNKPWFNYFMSVYNTDSPEKNGLQFPLNVGKQLSWFDQTELERLGLLGQTLTTSIFSSRVASLVDGDIFPGLDGISWCVGCLHVYRPRLETFRSSSRVEVLHCQISEPVREHAYWMQWAPGTGVFYNLGETISFDHHFTLCDHLRNEAHAGYQGCNECNEYCDSC